MGEKFICGACGSPFDRPKTLTRGSIWIEVVLWLFFILPGLLYSIWRLTTKIKVCPACRQANVLPFNSPVGQKIYRETHGN